MTTATGAPGTGAPAGPDEQTQAMIATAVAERDAELEKWKSLSRKHEEQAKANADKAKQFDGMQAANQTTEQTVQQLKGQIAQLQELHSETARSNAQLASAARNGLTPEDAEFLKGDTPDEIEASAKRLATRIGARPGGFPPLGQGPRGSASSPTNANDLLRAMRGS